MEKIIMAKTGNESMAEAMRQINPDVVAAYPITPATEVVQIFSSFVADGLVDTELVLAESEHSALSACVGAAAAGGRVMTSTASQGLALMHEVLFIAAGLRLPIVICEVNRSLSGPINIHCDHSDTMASRDSGWIQIYSENSQEAYDNTIQAMKIAEKAFLPAIVSVDAFIISHSMERLEVLPDNEVQKFIGEHKKPYDLLDVDNPITLGGLDLQDFFFEHKRGEIEAMKEAKPIIIEVGKEYGEKFGTTYGFFEEYMMEDADFAIIALGSTAGTTKVVVDSLRKKGMKVGLFKIRVFRPFPFEEIKKALEHIKVIAVLDRVDGMSSFGSPVFHEIRSCLYESETKPVITNYIYGLGGRDIFPKEIEGVYKELEEIAEKGKVKNLINYLGVRE
ncbi:pyruvate ferredoxin oxidoreductase [candidate division WOR-3 bacterium]|nr:pyruvate ferredoxin oxidoreductase [candidate division WOR-3 bacterium]MCK4575329.1 pyruvate ferredoxin oxidoreductase [candidate division WOR-3 bacterium]